MTRATTYPGADLSHDRSSLSGITMPKIDKVLLHTTETSVWPGYADFAPQLTVNPVTSEIRQHMPLNRSASTLRDPSDTAVRENRDDVVQIEIVGFSDPKEEGSPYHVSAWGDQEYAFLGSILKWFTLEWGVPLPSTVGWVACPASYGSKAKQRLTSSQYDAYSGILSHQHAPGNDHGDPGNIDIARLLTAAGATPTVTLPPARSYPRSAAPYVISLPVADGEIGYAYGVKDSQYRAGYHTGQDYRAKQGAAWLAVAPGVIKRMTNDPKGYGNWLVLQADNGRDYVYCHGSKIIVSGGQRVVPGQKIGEVGATGNATGPHLHLEDRPRGGGYGEVRKPSWPSWDGRSYPGRVFVVGQSHPATILLGQRLQAWLGDDVYEVGPSAGFTETDEALMKRFQQKIGRSQDGWPGPQEWAILLTEPGTTVAVPSMAEPKPEKPAATAYYVDPKKVSTKLIGRTWTGEAVKLRDPGFAITTGVEIVLGSESNPSLPGARKWLKTAAGYFYALDYLTTEMPGNVENQRKIKIATWNPYKLNSLTNMKRGLKAIIDAGASVIGVQELSVDSKQDGLTRYAESLGWRASKKNSAVTVFYDPSVIVDSKESHVVVEQGGDYWQSGAGGHDTIHKILMMIDGTHKSGKKVALLNHHLVPTVESGGKFRADKPIRVSVYKRQIAEFCDQVSRRNGLVFGTSDWNVAWGTSAGNWVEQQLDKVGVTVCWDDAPDRTTHKSNRTIDWTTAKGATTKEVEVLDYYGSDHRPVVTTYVF
ncbi:hypothetical protein MLP_13070 [Microlunatus phosphovorus NM-1]|uniref:M23ase beta-sheet core domain-containing protein n=1 Tax=Microlunatus phosphovorus (strain ATCC 700054 / DSM 10555 / JCM 9379 / NBRC 101784 / NCIMB 13414 / VKM Ac-1990 / NM-1) TaxID=1032480 RepID=F5XPL3_MICPN|nr:peptidoglycan DD-metalloendopeptidase family protein [Microlunatus phosphovorus]BAK34321.1 hypothetical protein MLP_13070 [Microlunatus phosphovorus NM-1]